MADELAPSQTGPLESPQPSPAKAAEAPQPAPEKPKDEEPGPLTSLIRQSGRGGLEAAQRVRSLDAERMQLHPPTVDLPPKPKDPNQSEINAWGAIALAFAAVAGRHTQTPMASAFNAAAGALNGMREGRLERVQENMEKWKIETDNAFKLGNFQMQSYKEALGELYHREDNEWKAGETRDAAVESKLRALGHVFGNARVAAALDGPDPIKNAAKVVRDDEEIAQKFEIQTKTLGKSVGAAVELGQWAKEKKEKGETVSETDYFNKAAELISKHGVDETGGRGSMWDHLKSPEQIEKVARWGLNGEIALPTEQDQLRSVGAQKVATLAHEIAQREGTTYDPNKFAVAKKAQERLTDGSSKPSLTLQQLETMQHHIERWEKLADQLPTTNKLSFVDKQLARLGRSVTGDPRIAAWDADVDLFAPEAVKIVTGSPGGGALADRESLKALMAAENPQAAVKARLLELKAAMGGRAMGFYESYSQKKMPGFVMNELDPQMFDRYEKWSRLPVAGEKGYSLKAEKEYGASLGLSTSGRTATKPSEPSGGSGSGASEDDPVRVQGREAFDRAFADPEMKGKWINAGGQSVQIPE